MSRLRFTYFWFLFGPVMICMWLAAVNYANNLIYAILYLVASLSFISIVHTRRNLSSIEVEHVHVRPAFAGEETEIEIHLRNRSSRASYNLEFERAQRRERKRVPLRPRGGGRVFLPGNDSRRLTVMLPQTPRGRYVFEKLVVRSAYPFGLFWSTFQVPVGATYFVYPTPHGREDLPETHPAGESGRATQTGEDFAGWRGYSPGEPLRHVDWRAYARGRPLLVKQFSGGEGQELRLDAQTLSRIPLEERLSQLTLWSLEAEEAEIAYGLSVGGIELAPALGPAHQVRVLEALATAGE